MNYFTILFFILIILIIIILYMIYPSSIGYNLKTGKRKFDEKNIRKCLIINSIVVTIVISMLPYLQTPDVEQLILNTIILTIVCAIPFYFINLFYLQKCIEHKKCNVENVKENKNTNKIELSKSFYCKLCGAKLDENKKCEQCGKQYFNFTIQKNKINPYAMALFMCIIIIIILIGIVIFQQQEISILNR